MKLIEILLPKSAIESTFIFTLTNYLRKVRELINGNLSFSDNFNGQFLSVTITESGTEYTKEHTLKREITGLIMTDTQGGVICKVSSTTANITVKATQPGNYKIFIF